MQKQSKRRRIVFGSSVAAGVIIAGIAGVSAGSAFGAGAAPVAAPVGVTSVSGAETTPMPAPKYKVNKQGDSYGSALAARSEAEEPDLIQVELDQGGTGYVRGDELKAAEGGDITTPAEAVAWSQGEGKKDHVVDAYGADGTTKLGTFTVHGVTG